MVEVRGSSDHDSLGMMEFFLLDYANTLVLSTSSLFYRDAYIPTIFVSLSFGVWHFFGT
ncbi:hypothetical protein BDN72DRAFT_839489 [Pluteus cervinus]|uniref:Uncharacterized protein n=1 Tax=Pluteus cervinus TaxID=181527 RepID=A0ACD3AWS9_9AGAR|nr:hypothetical protein BDN72DRAFT_839489 [Pluteus cervinus]